MSEPRRARENVPAVPVPPDESDVPVPKEARAAGAEAYRQGFQDGWQEGFETAVSLYTNPPPFRPPTEDEDRDP